MRRSFRLLILLFALSLVVAACSPSDESTETTEATPTATTEAAGAFTSTAPECVAPSGAGGGWDFTCRSIGLLFEQLVSTPNVVVTNQEGGGGAVAFADIAANRNDENDLTIAASPATAIRFGQNQYTGLVAEDFRWIGAIGADFGVLAVTPDSPYQSVADIVAAMQADAKAITFGGGSPVGGQDHFKLLMFAQEIGVDPAAVPWVAYDGGGEAQAALLGGEIEVAPLDVSEVFGNEDIKVLAVMSTDPVEGMDAPTLIQEGISMIFPVWRGLMGPGGMSDESYDFWVDALGQVEASDEWAVEREGNGLSPLRLLGADFETFAFDAVDDFRALSEPFGLVAGVEPTEPTEPTYVATAPECVAPSGAGGGWDFTCRSIGLLFEELVPTPNVVVTNQEGGGGAIAFADIAANRNDEDDLTIAASPATAIRFGQNQYGGLTADQFRWIGAIGADFGAFVVTPDSPYQTLDDMVAAMQADPTSITFGGGSPVGGQDHFKLLMFAEEIGVDPAVVPWVAYDGGGEAQAALLGGEIEVAPLDVSEVFGNEDLLVLAVMASDPVEGMDAQTTVDLGYETIFPVWRGLLAPGGMSDEAYDFWVDALGQVEASDEWAVERANNGLSPLRLLGVDFEAFALDAVQSFHDLSEPFGLVIE